MDDRTQRQVALNEARFRDMNERHRSAVEDLHGQRTSGTFTMMCECAHTNCDGMLDIDFDAYRQVRRDPTRFIVLPDHAIAEAEQLIAEHDGYWVVGKVGEGASVAREQA